MASQITGVSIVCLIVCSGLDERKHQSPVSLVFMKGIHRSPVDSPHKVQVARKNFRLITSPWKDVSSMSTYLLSPHILHKFDSSQSSDGKPMFTWFGDIAAINPTPRYSWKNAVLYSRAVLPITTGMGLFTGGSTPHPQQMTCTAVFLCSCVLFDFLS